MKVALVCIAKNEDDYIQEWINYHLKLGFDNIFIYENDWDSNINHNKVTKIKVSGPKQQIPSYNSFVQQYKESYDWCAFLDVDEFLVLKKHSNVHDFVSDFKEYAGIGINWVLFGDNNKTDVEDFSVIKRFTKRQSTPNDHVKSIINLKKCGFIHVHGHMGESVDTNKTKIIESTFNKNGPIDVAQINHYFCKTKNEFIKKINRGRADTGTFRDIKEYEIHNYNETEDLTAFNFMYNDNNNIFNPQR